MFHFSAAQGRSVAASASETSLKHAFESVTMTNVNEYTEDAGSHKKSRRVGVPGDKFG
jgi:hypothetical protein